MGLSVREWAIVARRSQPSLIIIAVVPQSSYIIRDDNSSTGCQVRECGVRRPRPRHRPRTRTNIHLVMQNNSTVL